MSTTLVNVSGHPYHLGAACVRVEAGGSIDVDHKTCPTVIKDLRVLYDAGHFVEAFELPAAEEFEEEHVDLEGSEEEENP